MSNRAIELSVQYTNHDADFFQRLLDEGKIK